MNEKRWRNELSGWAEKGLLRRRTARQGTCATRHRVGRRSLLSFSSNDYLGLAQDERVLEAFCQGAQKYGVGTGGSCLLTGYRESHEELETKLAAFTGRERALLFSTGYMANLGVLGVLGGRKRTIFLDRMNHASLIDAARVSGSSLRRFAHCDLSALEKALLRCRCLPAPVNDGGRFVVAVESIFSMEGSLAPLAEMAGMCQKHEACLVVDDAHGFGVLGKRGAGVTEHLGLGSKQLPVVMGTFGKACGTFGAFVAASQEFIELLIQKARTYVYTTAPPAALACATLVSLRLIEEEPWRRKALQARIRQFRELAQKSLLPCLDSQTAIQGLVTGSSALACELGDKLLQEGIEVLPIRPPTVPRNTARLRISLSAMHSEEDIDSLVSALLRVLPRSLLKAEPSFPANDSSRDVA